MTCKDTTMKTEPVRIQPGRKLTENLNEGEKTQLLSVVGSLNWIARQCRPDISYRVSRLRSRVNIGTIADLKEANKVLAYAIATADQGLTFKSGVLDWNNLVSAVVTDASHANEVEELKDGRVEAHRSQGA